jgi:hypothetical protein
MPARLNHTIVAARDQNASALFLAEMLGLPAPLKLGHFTVVSVGDHLTLDFISTDREIVPQHYAFLVDEAEFDAIFERIAKRRLPYWSDPFRRQRDKINHWDDGRGLYFDDPNGHLLEIITRPYGSKGTEAANPHPLVASKVEATDEHDDEPPASQEADRHGGGALARAEQHSR